MFRSFVLLIFGILFFASAAESEPLQQIPELHVRVTDLSGTLKSTESRVLEAVLDDFERQKGSQIAVLIVPTTKPEEIEQYSIRVVDAWKLGRKGVGDGVLLLVAKNDRRVRVEVGRGLEGALNDATTKRIIEEQITPRFREGKFFEGIKAGVESIVNVINGEPLPAPVHESRQGGGSGFPVFLIFAAAIAGAFAGRFLKDQFRAPVLAGLVAALIAFLVAWVFSSVIFAIISAVLSPFMMADGAILNGLPGGGGWTSGGGSGGSSDWGGGGGDFGGGGASGSW